MATQKKITDLQLRSSVDGNLNFPSDDTIQSYRVTASQIFDYIRGRIPPESGALSNVTLTAAVGASALTIAIKNRAGNDATATDPVRVAFRSSNLALGGYSLVEITSALSLVISNGSTLGQISTKPSRIYVYLLNAGTGELAVSSVKIPESQLISTTAEGGLGTADSLTVVYSTTARTNVSHRLIGYIDNTQATAGTWATAPTQIQLLPFVGKKAPTFTKLSSGTGTYYVPQGCTRLRIRFAGGGGGGAGSGAGSGTAGAAGGTTTFGSSLLSASGGAGGNSFGGGGAFPNPGGGSLGTGPVGVAGSGNYGTQTSYNVTVNNAPAGGPPGSSPLGFGTGGPGAIGPSSGSSGGGGAGGGWGDCWIDCLNVAWAASYAWAVGAGGTGGASGAIGADGQPGVILIEEHYE